MKILFFCHECMNEAAAAGLRSTESSTSTVRLSPTDSGVYEIRCGNGHVTPQFLQQMRFEVLFQIGAHAIIDGYYREAISSFTSALERFLELYIRVVCRRNNLHPELVTSIWKLVNNQSERQLGAYLFLYGITEHTKAPHLSQAMTELRNNVVHKGRLPSRDDAVAFGNSVLAIINPTLRRLKERDHDILQEMVRQHIAEAQKSASVAVAPTMFLRTIISVGAALSVPDTTDIASWEPPAY